MTQVTITPKAGAMEPWWMITIGSGALVAVKFCQGDNPYHAAIRAAWKHLGEQAEFQITTHDGGLTNECRMPDGTTHTMTVQPFQGGPV